MQRKRIVWIVVGLLVVLGAAGGGAYFLLLNPSVGQSDAGDLEASGFIEAEEVALAPEMGGRVLDLRVDEGDAVQAGEVVVRLDGAMIEAQIEAAQAALDLAQAQLAQARAGVRPERIRQAEADLVKAKAGRDGAYQAWQDLIALRENPQQLNAQIVQAEAQVAAAEAALTQAVAMKDAVEIAHEDYKNARDKLDDIPPPFRPGLQIDFHLIPNAYWKAWVGVNTAKVALQGARAALNDLYAMRENPQQLNAQIDAAETEYRKAEAAVRMAQARLDGLEAGATPQEIAIAEAKVEQAEAALASLLVVQDKQTIAAPVGGMVLEVNIREGELAVPGSTLLTLGDLDQVTLTVYVPQNRLGQVNVGQSVVVTVDSFPDRTFGGTVVEIADEAEFTPRNVQTKEERVNMVFAVEIRIPNQKDEDGVYPLKPGVPADAIFVTEEVGR